MKCFLSGFWFEAMRNLVAIVALSCAAKGVFPKVKFNDNQVHLKGDITIGGLLALHGSIPSSQDCSSYLIDEFVISIQAIIYAIQKSNEAQLSKFDITLGLSAFDTCSNPHIGYQQAFQWATANRSDPERIWVVTGSLGSETAISVSILLQAAEIPMLSQHGSYDLLSNHGLTPMSLQMSPRNSLQAKAILTLLLKMNWTVVILVSGQDRDSINLLEEFHYFRSRMIEFRDICVRYEMKLSFYQPAAETSQNVMEITDHEGVIVLMANLEMATYFFTIFNSTNRTEDYQIVGSNSLAHSNFELFDFVDGIISVVPLLKPYPNFTEYLQNLTLKSACINPWMAQLIGRQKNCCPDTCQALPCRHEQACRDDERLDISKTIGIDSAYLAVESIEIITEALERIQQTKCTDKNKTDCLKIIFEMSGTETFSYLNQSASVVYTRFLKGKFSYVQLNKYSEAWQPVGAFDTYSKEFSLDLTNHSLEQVKRKTRPWLNCRSKCSSALEHPTNISTCCWNCSRCSDDFIEIRLDNCAYCILNDNANEKCERYHPIAIDTEQTAIWVLLSLIFVVCLLSSVVLAILLLYRKTPFVEAILMGPTICVSIVLLGLYLTTVLYFVAYPNGQIMCVGTTVSMALCSYTVWSLLFFKMFFTNRFAEILNGSNPFSRQAESLGNRVCIFVFCTLVITTASLAIYFVLSPEAYFDAVHIFRHDKIWIVCPCHFNPITILFMLPAYLLCIGATYIASKHRDSQIWIFRFEAQLIFSVGLVTLVISILYPSVVYTVDHQEHQPLISLVYLAMTPSVVLFVYLGPVVFNLLYRKNRNTREFLFHREKFIRVNGQVMVMLSLEEYRDRLNERENERREVND